MASRLRQVAATALVVLCVLIFIAGSLVLTGLTPVVPGRRASSSCSAAKVNDADGNPIEIGGCRRELLDRP